MTKQRFAGVAFALMLSACGSRPDIDVDLFAQDAMIEEQPVITQIAVHDAPFVFDPGPFTITIMKYETPADEAFAYFEEHAGLEGCNDPVRPDGYFSALRSSFQDATMSFYELTGETEDRLGRHHVVVLQNTLPYTDVKTADEDFFECGVGTLQAIDVSPDFLLLEGSCGGVDSVCGELREQILPSLKLRK